MRLTTILTASIILAALAILPAGAAASSKQVAVFQDDTLLLERSDATRRATLAELDGLGVDVVKAGLQWAAVAPRSKTKPAGFDGSNPAAYPAARWAPLDALVRESHALGLRVMIALTPPAPGWATRKHGDTAGVDRPSAVEYGRFAEAVG